MSCQPPWWPCRWVHALPGTPLACAPSLAMQLPRLLALLGLPYESGRSGTRCGRFRALAHIAENVCPLPSLPPNRTRACSSRVRTTARTTRRPSTRSTQLCRAGATRCWMATARVRGCGWYGMGALETAWQHGSCRTTCSCCRLAGTAWLLSLLPACFHPCSSCFLIHLHASNCRPSPFFPLPTENSVYMRLEKWIAAKWGVEPRGWFEPDYSWTEQERPGTTA